MKLSTSQAAEHLGLSRQRVQVLVAEGRIKCEKTPIGNLFEKKDLDAFAKIPRNPGRPS